MGPPKAKLQEHADLSTHTVAVDDNYYALDKATLVHLPHPIALTLGQADVLRCFVMPKSSTLKLGTNISSSWLVHGELQSIVLPKLVAFDDEREKCVAIFFRQSSDGRAPRVVCLRTPLVGADDKPLSDADLVACKLSQISEFSPIRNESGGSLLTQVNKYLASSALFKYLKLDSVKSVHAAVQSAVVATNVKSALTYLELSIRRAKKTTRIGEKDPKSKTGQEDQRMELARLKNEMELLDVLRSTLANSVVEPYSVPLKQRIITIPATITDETTATVAMESIIRDHPHYESVLKELKEKELLRKVMAVEPGGCDEADVVCTPIKKPTRPVEAAPPEAAPAEVPAGESIDVDDDEFPEPDDAEAASITVDDTDPPKRQRKPIERFDAGAVKSKGSRGRAPKVSAPATTTDAEQKPKEKHPRGPRARDEQGNPVRMKYQKKGGAPLAALPPNVENDGQHAKLQTRLEKALADSASLRQRVAELEAEQATLRATIQIKDSELVMKDKELVFTEREATFKAKTEMQGKMEDAFQRGFASAQRNFESIAQLAGRAQGPPNSARMASYGSISRASSGSMRSGSGEDDF